MICSDKRFKFPALTHNLAIFGGENKLKYTLESQLVLNQIPLIKFPALSQMHVLVFRAQTIFANCPTSSKNFYHKFQGLICCLAIQLDGFGRPSFFSSKKVLHFYWFILLFGISIVKTFNTLLGQLIRVSFPLKHKSPFTHSKWH